MKFSDIQFIPQLYHLSDDDTLTKLTPKIPDWLSDRKNAFENSSIPRISVAETIEGCILGLQLTEKDFHYNLKSLYVYSPIITYDTRFITNKLLTKKKLVFDSYITREWWLLDQVDVEYIGEILLTDLNFKTIYYKPLSNSKTKFKGKIDTTLYRYKWINKQ